jgi:hypothetical protein
LTRELPPALGTYERRQQQAPRLPQDKQRRPGHLGNAYDLTLAPILTGQSHCPAPFGRKPGMGSEPATEFIFADGVPPGHPQEPRAVRPLSDKGPDAIERVRTGPKRQIHSVASDLGRTDAVVRQARQARGLLTVGIPQTIQPLEAHPRAQESLTMLNAAGCNRRAPRITCRGPVPVARGVRWWKATSPVCSHAGPATGGTKALQALYSNTA